MVRHGSLGLPEFDFTLTGIPPKTPILINIHLTAVNALLRSSTSKEDRVKYLQLQKQLLAEAAELERENKT